MSCFNNLCGNSRRPCGCVNEVVDRAAYRVSPYPVYPPSPCNGIQQVRLVENCNGRPNGYLRESEDIFKAATLGDEEVLRKASIPFNFNAFGDKRFIKHFPHDNNFSIERDGLYRVVYKLNFTPSADGMVNLVLRQDGTAINETLVITNAENNQYTTVTFDDVIQLHEGAIIDLQLTDNSTISAITVVNPYIIFEYLD